MAWLRARMSPPHRSIVELIAGGVLDAELAALAWLLVEARLPVIVGGLARGAGKTTVLEAILDFLPATVERLDLAGDDEDFAWLPEAERLGWRAPPPTADADVDRDADPSLRPRAPASPAATYLVAAELSEHFPLYTWGRAARTLVRAATLGYGIAATIHADRLEEIHDALRAFPVRLTDDELSYLGLVLVVRADRGPDGHIRRRVVAAHYARPVGRDEHGHVQRLPPAVLAARDERSDRLDHFAWGVMPELAIRLGRTAAEIERDLADRSALLDALGAAGTGEPDAVRRAIRSYRPAAWTVDQRRVH